MTESYTHIEWINAFNCKVPTQPKQSNTQSKLWITNAKGFVGQALQVQYGRNNEIIGRKIVDSSVADMIRLFLDQINPLRWYHFAGETVIEFLGHCKVAYA